MLQILKKIIGVAPKLESDGSYSPSWLALKLATSDKSDFENLSYTKYQGKKSKILVLFTEQKNMTMKNGKMFSTGNHPVESLVPLLHLRNAGFKFEITTPSGKPVVLEKWAFPKKDEQLTSLFEEIKTRLEKPLSLGEFVKTSLGNTDEYAAIFVPGGHGAMLGLPEDKNVDILLRRAHEHDLFTISICHGPGAFLATTLDDQEFLYKGYNMTVFPDSVDKITPYIGYLPGDMPVSLSEPLKSLGANLVNTKADKTVCVDRKLITGASPQASNELGKLATKTLINELE